MMKTAKVRVRNYNLKPIINHHDQVDEKGTLIDREIVVKHHDRVVHRRKAARGNVPLKKGESIVAPHGEWWNDKSARSAWAHEI